MSLKKILSKISNFTKMAETSSSEHTNTENIKKSTDSLFPIFSFVFGFYLCIHMLLVHEQSFSNSSEYFKYIPAIFGLILMLKPRSVGLFMSAVTISFIDTWIAFPVFSNSTFLTFVLELVIITSFTTLVFQNKSIKVNADQLFDNFAPGGRLTLLTIYFFGIFQKLNSDFLDVDVSCAAIMMQYFHDILPKSFTTDSVVLYMAIYGTLVVETIILLCLIFKKYRHLGIVIGMGFHVFLSMNEYQYFQPFTTLAFLLHILFLNPETFKKWKNSSFIYSLCKHKNLKILFYVAGAVIWALTSYAWINNLNPPAFLIWLPIGLYMWIFTIIYDKPYNKKIPNYFFSKNCLVTLIAGLFFLQCFSPYFGFKTQQTINMYSNLRTESGISNHLIFRKPLYLFDYQTDLVEVVDTNDRWLSYIKYQNLRIIEQRFFDYIARHPNIKVTYAHKDKKITSLKRTQKQISEWKPHPLSYKLMVWQDVPASGKMPCGN